MVQEVNRSVREPLLPNRAQRSSHRTFQGLSDQRTFFVRVVDFFFSISDQMKSMADYLFDRVCYSKITFPVANRIHALIFGETLKKTVPPFSEKPQENRRIPENLRKKFFGANPRPVMAAAPVNLTNVRNSCWANSFWQLIMALPFERELIEALEGNLEYPQPDICFRNEIMTYQNAQRNRVSRLGDDYTHRIQDRLLQLMLRNHDYHQQDPLEVVQPFLNNLSEVIQLRDFLDLPGEVKWADILISILRFGEPETGVENKISSNPGFPRENYGAILGTEDSMAIVPSEEVRDFSVWLRRFFNPPPKDVNGKTIIQQRNFLKPPHMFFVKVLRTANGQDMSLNNQEFITHSEEVFGSDLAYALGPETTRYRRVGCIIHDGKFEKNSSSGHYYSYIEQTDGRVFLCNDMNKEVQHIQEGTPAYDRYVRYRDHHAVLFLYTQVLPEGNSCSV